MNLNATELSKIIRHRRSIPPEQMDGSRKVDESIIDEMLENANWAPTHGLTEPWRFSVFSGEALSVLAHFQAELYKQLTPVSSFKQTKYDKLMQRPLLVSHVFSIGMKRQESGKIPEIEEVEATACAVQNMLLTAAAHGIGAYWTSGGVTYLQEANDFFGLGINDKLLGFLYVGYPKGAWMDGRRNSIGEKVRKIYSAGKNE